MPIGSRNTLPLVVGYFFACCRHEERQGVTLIYTLGLADVAVGPAVPAFGLLAAVLALIVIILAEAVVLRILKWGDFRPCLVDSLLTNVASGVVGLVAAPFLPNNGFSAWLIELTLSVVIEGGVLMLRRRHPAGKTWVAALVSNLASYLVIGAILLVNR